MSVSILIAINKCQSLFPAQSINEGGNALIIYILLFLMLTFQYNYKKLHSYSLTVPLSTH